MNILKKSSKSDRSASDVQRHYNTRIESFLEEVGGSSKWWSREEPLDSLFDWASRLRSKHRKSEQQLAAQIATNTEQKEALKNQQETVLLLQREKDGLVRQLHEARSEKSRLEQRLRDDTRRLREDHERKMQQNADRTRRILEDHEMKMRENKENHEAIVQSLKDMHAAREASSKAAHRTEVDRLVGQLLVNQEDDQEWPDDKLKLHFGELQRLVLSVASPSRTEFRIPANSSLGPELDPTGMIQTLGRGKVHYLLKSVIWGIVQEHFFSIPYGFGAFGPGDAHAELFSVFEGWMKLCRMAGRFDISDLAVFEMDGLANKWRTTTFQALKGITDEATGSADSSMFRLRATNAANAEQRILTYLSAIAALSQNSVSQAVKDEVGKVVKLASEIALHFGIHSAKLVLLNPTPPVKGDPAPGLLKFGRDKGGDPTRHTIVACPGYIE